MMSDLRSGLFYTRWLPCDWSSYGYIPADSPVIGPHRFSYLYQFPDERLKAQLGAAGIEAEDLPDINHFSEVDGSIQTAKTLQYQVRRRKSINNLTITNGS